MTSPLESAADVRPWRGRDAALAVAGGIGGVVLASLVLGVEELTVTEVFGILVPAQAAATIAVLWLMARTREPIREALALRWESNDGLGLLVGAGLQLGLSLAAAPGKIAEAAGDVSSQSVPAVTPAGGVSSPQSSSSASLMQASALSLGAAPGNV